MKKYIICSIFCMTLVFVEIFIHVIMQYDGQALHSMAPLRGSEEEDRWKVAALTEERARRARRPESLVLHPSELTKLPLPLFLRDVMPDPALYNIYQVVTSLPNTLSLRHFCSLESYCLENPDATVWFLLLGLDSIEGNQLRILEGMQRMYPNLQLASLDLLLTVKGTPLESIVTSGKLKQSDYPANHLSDVLRLAVVSKAGGMYTDFDFICLRSVTGVRNSLAQELPEIAMNGLFHFDAGHPFLQLIMEEDAINFNPQHWSWNGPSLFTRLLTEYCRGYHFLIPDKEMSNLLNKIQMEIHLQTPVPFPAKASVNTTSIASVHDPTRAESLCRSVALLQPSAFMPVYAEGMEKMFQNGSVDSLLNVPAESYALHLFNAITSKTVLVEDSALHVVAQRYCPQTHATVHSTAMTL